MDLTVQAMSGVMACTGFDDRPPVKSGAALCDFFGAVHLYGAAVSALFDAQRSGKGRFVEVSMLEAVYPTLSSPLGLYHSLGQKNPPRTGNRHNGLAESPYNVYPVTRWLGRTVLRDRSRISRAWRAQWIAPIYSRIRDSRLSSRASTHMDELDAVISEWTGRHTKAELMTAHEPLSRAMCAGARARRSGQRSAYACSAEHCSAFSIPISARSFFPQGPMRYADAETHGASRPARQRARTTPRCFVTGWG